TTPVATSQTDSDGRYTLQLPANTAGKDIVVIAEKSVAGGTLRLSTIVADVPREGKVGVDLDAATTLSTEQIVYVAKNQNILNFAPNAISIIFSEVREIVSQLSQLNLVAGAEDSPIPLNFGAGLREINPASQVMAKVEEQMGNLPAPSDPNVATAKSIVQMLRDFGLTLVGIGENEILRIQEAIEEQQRVISNEVKLAEEFTERMDFPVRVLSALVGEPAGDYEEVDFGELERVGDTDGKTWRVTSKVGETQGMVLTITSQRPMEFFEITPEAGVYTLKVRKQGEPSVQYDGKLQFTANPQGVLTSIALNITIRDKELSKPISFNGTVSGVVASGSTSEEPEYSKVSFSGAFSSQFGTAQVGKLEVVTTVVNEDRAVQKVTLTNLQVAIQTSKPASLTLNGTIELEPTPIKWREEWGDMMPKLGSITATLQASGITVSLSNAKVYDFVVDEGIAVPRHLTGELNYTSPSLTFQGEINAFYEGLGADTPSEQVKLTISELRGNWKPTVGSPLSVSITVNSNSQTITIGMSLSQGTQKLEGTFTGDWKFVDGETEVANGVLNLTHSPSGFKVQVSQQEGQPVTGTIKTAQGQTVAQIGEAQSLGVDLGKTLIVKYTDGTFETLQSILPRSRMSQR
ncbi:MAG: hypothetical protein RMK89_07545, partial [Armatimonadota bacterium]|nr:hypothetical protein [Armatimonadota bacterium]MDW8143300.1 hypothetical protein [Armatimonadota bacterium]